MVQADVAVVGGGPAGVAAAITLARAGRDVILFDKARFPRDKCCGDGLTTSALRRYERLGLRPESVASWHQVTETWLESPSHHRIRLPLPDTGGSFAACARRVDLDAAFLDVARAEGVKVYDGHAVADIEERLELVRMEVDGIGSVLSRYVVAADGMWSPIRKRLAPDEPGYLGEWHALRQYFSGVAPAAAHGLWVWFDHDLIPGYAWSFPLPGNRANVGFGIRRKPGLATHEMKGQWADLLQRPHIRAVLGADAQPESATKAWPIPARINSSALVAGRVLFAGDAARATDNMTGEGIGQALETGELAAHAIIVGGPRQPAQVSAYYRRQVATGMGVDDRYATFLSGMLSHSKGVRGAIGVVGATDWSRRNFARWLWEDYPRAAFFTPHRWRRGMLHGLGAYRDIRPAPGAAVTAGSSARTSNGTTPSTSSGPATNGNTTPASAGRDGNSPAPPEATSPV